MNETYQMSGDLKKAPQMQENMIQDMQYLQEQLGQASSCSKDEENGKPAPEVVAAQKHLATRKFAYVADQQRAAISNNS